VDQQLALLMGFQRPLLLQELQQQRM